MANAARRFGSERDEGEPGAADQAAAAHYIAEMSEELAKMATARRLDMLAYLLDMARLEAEAAMNGTAREAPARQ